MKILMIMVCIVAWGLAIDHYDPDALGYFLVALSGVW